MRRQISIFAILACVSIGVILGIVIVRSHSLIAPVSVGDRPGQNQVLGAVQTPFPTPEPVGSPKTLSIPKIGVTANVEHVGMDNQGRMDIPRNSNNTAWYNLGPKPVLQLFFGILKISPAVTKLWSRMT
jgi:hypothetical protein